MFRTYNYLQPETLDNSWSDYLTNAKEPRIKYGKRRKQIEGDFLTERSHQKHMLRAYAERLRHEDQ